MPSTTTVAIYSISDLVGYSSNPQDNWGNGQAFDTITGSITTGPTLNPIVIEITDTGVDNANDDQFLTIINSVLPGSSFDEAPTLPTITNGPAALVGQNIFLTSTAAPGAANHITAPDHNGNTIEIYEVEINGQLYIVATGQLVPGFTYDEGAPGFGDFGAQSATYTQLFVCFVRGTKLRTQNKPKRIEDLAIGDLLWTQDHGFQPIRWIGSSIKTKAALQDSSNLRPIRIQAGSISAGMPAEDLIVSQQHRILVRSKIAEKMFGVSEVFVPAKKLIAVEGFEIEPPTGEVEYFHVFFDEHQIIEANGVLSESLLPGTETLKILNDKARQELEEIAPEIQNKDFVATPARMIAKGKRVQKLVERHIKNDVPLQSVCAPLEECAKQRPHAAITEFKAETESRSNGTRSPKLSREDPASDTRITSLREGTAKQSLSGAGDRAQTNVVRFSGFGRDGQSTG